MRRRLTNRSRLTNPIYGLGRIKIVFMKLEIDPHVIHMHASFFNFMHI